MKDSHSYLIFRIAILFILSFNFLFVGAQTGNNFTIGCNTRIYALGEQLTASVDIKANGIGDMVSNYDGTLLFYISGWGVFSDTGKISHNADITGYDNSNQQNRFSVIRLNDSTFYVFYGKIDSTIQKPVAVNFRTQYYSVVRIKNGAPTIDPGEEDIIFYPGSILGQTVIEDALGGSWLIYQTSSNTFNSFYFSETCFGCKPNSSTIDWPLNVGYYFSHNSYLKRSSTGNRISAVSEIQYFTPVPVGTSKITLVTDSVRAGILDLNFDKTTGEVSLQHIIVHQLFKYDPTGAGSYERKKSGFTEISCSYSTNDSLFYYSNRNDQLSKLYIKQFIFSNGQTKELYSNNVGLITELHWFNGEKLYAFFPVTIPSYLYKLIEIQNGNDFQNLNQTLKYGPPIIGDVRCEGKGGYSKYNYIRVKPKFTYRCDATVTFNDLCDHSPGDARITYEVEDTAGSGNLIYKGANPALVYTEDGDYLYRVTYVSDKANYKEIHYDTFHVRIPVKPVADFFAEDSVVCAFQPLRFYDASSAQSINPDNPEKWVWSFGDGETQTVVPKDSLAFVSHIYKAPGTYSVSLFYSNGYCDSTLVKNQYIRVVEAPSPGFALDNNRGCSPFTVHFTDTVHLYVTKKEYYFSDRDTWKEIEQDQFSYTFDSAGTFYTVQRLQGFTGCVTQRDTEFIYVTPGITSSDTTHILFATFEHDFPDFRNESIRSNIEWTTLPAATQYNLYRGASPATAQTLTKGNFSTFTDTTSGINEWYYVARAEDSCGNLSSPGNYGKLILVKGEIAGNNEFAVVQWSPYELWPDAEIEYQIYDITDGNFRLLNSSINNTAYQDEDLLSSQALERCYLIKATNKTFSSFSNIICLKYKPVIFIPNAISPNHDGLNDVFNPVIYGVDSYKLKIYNRWGEEVYSENNGAWLPDEKQSGVFLYQITLITAEGEIVHQTGTISVVR